MDREVFDNIKKKLAELIKDTIFEGKVFVVGGCVRDMLLEHEIKDIDIAVNLPDGGIELARHLYINGHLVSHPVTFETYGTAMFKLTSYPDIELEAVQTRKEKYPDPSNRNPVSVFGSIEEDCLRRDLTINSLYQNVNTDEIIDITKRGLLDLHDEIIRTPCDPNITYDDDPLRILRTVRFASRYKWEIDKQTYQAMKNNIYRLGIITKERINAELTKMLEHDNAVHAMNLLKEINAFYIIAPDIQMLCNDIRKWEDTMKILGTVCHAHQVELSIAALLSFIAVDDSIGNYIIHETGIISKKPEEIMKSLKFSNASIDKVNKLIKYHRLHPFGDLLNSMSVKVPFYMEPYMNTSFDLNHITMRRFQYEIHNKELFNEIMMLSEAWWLTTYFGVFCNPYPGIVDLCMQHDTFFNYTLPVNGNDLINECAMERGIELKNMLIRLLDVVFEKPELSREELLDIARKIINNEL